MKDSPPELRTVNVTRYVVPLREGGSLPAIVEADDGFLYVLKFRGAGQGVKALIAELIGGEIVIGDASTGVKVFAIGTRIQGAHRHHKSQAIRRGYLTPTPRVR